MNPHGVLNEDPNRDAAADRSLRDEPALWLPRLTRVIDDQLVLAQRLDEMSRRQHALALEGDVPAILSVLADREPVVAQMTALALQFEPFAGRLGMLSARLEPADREALIERITRLDALVAGINERDEADRRTLERRRIEIGAELVGLGKGREAVSAYGTSRTPGAMFQDRQV